MGNNGRRTVERVLSDYQVSPDDCRMVRHALKENSMAKFTPGEEPAPEPPSGPIKNGWYFGAIVNTETPVVPVRVRWRCPQRGCTGEMVFNGMTWPTGTPGYHHTCDTCGLTLARPGEKFPRVEYREAP